MIRATIQIVLTASLLAGVISTAQKATPQSDIISDAAWTRAFAVPWQNGPASPPLIHNRGREQALGGDPRFPLLLKSSFHQQQWFWQEHYRFIPVADLVQTFLGLPGSAILDEGRYVTIDGCVPHDCGDRGMLWIDTGIQSATIIFVATGTVRSVQGSDQIHLWLFANKHLDFENLPPAFLSSLQRWRDHNSANGYKEEIVLTTLVQPNAQQVDLTYPTLYFQKNMPGAKK